MFKSLWLKKVYAVAASARWCLRQGRKQAPWLGGRHTVTCARYYYWCYLFCFSPYSCSRLLHPHLTTSASWSYSYSGFPNLLCWGCFLRLPNQGQLSSCLLTRSAVSARSHLSLSRSVSLGSLDSAHHSDCWHCLLHHPSSCWFLSSRLKRWEVLSTKALPGHPVELHEVRIDSLLLAPTRLHSLPTDDSACDVPSQCAAVSRLSCSVLASPFPKIVTACTSKWTLGQLAIFARKWISMSATSPTAMCRSRACSCPRH